MIVDETSELEQSVKGILRKISVHNSKENMLHNLMSVDIQVYAP